MSRSILVLAALLFTLPAHAAELYLTVGAGYGESSMTPKCAPSIAPAGDGVIVTGHCSYSNITGVMANVELGIEAKDFALFASHASNPTTNKDIGTTVIGVRYKLRKQL